MRAKAEIFFDAITLLREDIVEEAQDYRFRKKPAVWKKFGSLAACLALAVSLSLLILPVRGCGSSGGSGGNADMNTSGAPPAQNADGCAPADEPVSGDTAPEPSEAPAGYGDPEYGQAGRVQFTAVVIGMDEDAILVEDEGGQFLVPTAGLELPALAVGDRVRITHTGLLWSGEPAEILETISIEKIENDG